MSDEIAEAYNLIRAGKFDRANEILTSAMVYDLKNNEVELANLCCNFWSEVFKHVGGIDDTFERGEFLANEWKSFLLFLDRQAVLIDRTVFAVQLGVFSIALGCYNMIEEEREKKPEQKAEIYRKRGLCYKKLGEYETAKKNLSTALSLLPTNSAIIAEAADCYALCAEEKKAKLLFREAFFLDASRIEIAFLDSEMINCLVREVLKNSDADLLAWIPVYGRVMGIFSVRRELKPQEVERIKREIYAKEREMKEEKPSSDCVPRLLNLYFWLIDYYISAKKDIGDINEILVRVKILDENIYNLFVR